MHDSRPQSEKTRLDRVLQAFAYQKRAGGRVIPVVVLEPARVR
jgi:hypothetical protein